MALYYDLYALLQNFFFGTYELLQWQASFLMFCCITFIFIISFMFIRTIFRLISALFGR